MSIRSTRSQLVREEICHYEVRLWQDVPSGEWAHALRERQVVPGGRDEYLAWARAGDRCLREVRRAEEELRRAEGRTLLPGRDRRLERARDRCRTRIEAAAAQYRPVYEAIEGRLARQAEMRAERCRAFRRKSVWGWIVLDRQREADVVLVFRHDVKPALTLTAGDRRSGRPLDTGQLEQALLDLAAEGVRTVRWDDATRRRVVADCANLELDDESAELTYQAEFRSWWQEVTARGWYSEEWIPVPPPPDRPYPSPHRAQPPPTAHPAPGPWAGPSHLP